MLPLDMRLEDGPNIGGMNTLPWKFDREAARIIAPGQHDTLSPDVVKVEPLDVLVRTWLQLQP